MTFVPVEHAAMLVIEWGNASVQWTNTLWFVRADYDATNLQELTAIPNTAADATTLSLIHISYNLLGARAYDMRAEDGPVADSTWVARAGTQTGSVLPIQDACVITLRTNARGRSARGRLYFTGMTEPGLNLGVWTPAVTDEWVDFVEDLQAAAAALGWTHVVASRYLNGAPRASGFTRAVTAVESRSAIPGNQQRRSRRP